MLKIGIPAIKLNYSNRKWKYVVVRIADRGSTLEYTPSGADSLLTPATRGRGGLCARLFGPTTRRMHIGDFKGLVYGGLTASFNRHKKHLAARIHKQDRLMLGSSKGDNTAGEEGDGRRSASPPDFYAWQCISLVREFSTLDFIVRDEGHLQALFYYAWSNIYALTESKFMSVYRKLKFKMKLAYEC